MYYFGGVSDQSNSWAMLRMQNVTKVQMQTASQELASGEKDVRKVARAGDVGRVFALERTIETLERYSQSMGGGRARLEAGQVALQTIRELSNNVNIDVLSMLEAGSYKTTEIAAAGAVPAFRSVVANLNTQVAGHALFAGAKIDSAALKPADEILADVEAILAAAPDAATAIADVDAYFYDPGAGFESSAYVGSLNDGPDIALGEGDTVAWTVRADDQEMRDTMRNLAIMAAVSNGAYTGSTEGNRAILRDAAERGLTANDNLIRVQEFMGYGQERVEMALTRNESERLRVSITRQTMTEADPYETAGKFTQLESQLTALYTLTRRMSDMSLVNFI